MKLFEFMKYFIYFFETLTTKNTVTLTLCGINSQFVDY